MPISRVRGWPAWQICLVAGTAATVLYALLPTTGWWQPIGYALLGTSCVAAVLAAVRHYRPQQRSTWHTFIAGLFVWLLSSIVNRLSAAPAWSLTNDLLDLAGYPLICWALVGLIRGRARAQDRTALIDAGLVATSLSLLYWVFVIGAAVADDTVAWPQKTLTVLVAIGDIAMFTLGSLLITTPGARTVSYRLILGAMLLTALSDIVVIVVPSEPTPADAISLLANTLVAAAALHPSMRRLTVPLSRPPAFVRPRLVLLTAMILIAPALGLYQGATGHADRSWLATGISTIALFLLVAARMAGLVSRVETQAHTLARLARHDALTGLPNRRRWDERLPEALSESAATGESLFIALLDLDHFKIFNDTYGHPAGDELLTHAATAWQRQLRDGDLLARYGGEEFAVLLTGCTPTEAQAILQRLLSATPGTQTFSAGLVRWDGQESPEFLLNRADQLLYASKHAGRAQVTPDPTIPTHAATPA